jgi:hypothetical protein
VSCSVTRLLKASKIKSHSASSNPSSNRSSFSAPPNPRDSSSTLSLSLGSSSSSNAKLLQAQAELQACEATLAEKEAELDVLRLRVLREGLEDRCRALVRCARTWADAGEDGLRTLAALGGDLRSPNGHGTSRPPSRTCSPYIAVPHTVTRRN